MGEAGSSRSYLGVALTCFVDGRDRGETATRPATSSWGELCGVAGERRVVGGLGPRWFCRAVS